MFAASQDPAWVLAETGYAPPDAASRAARFTVSNGFLGVAATPTILLERVVDHGARTLVAGLFDQGVDRSGPALTQGPDWISMRLRIDGAASVPGADASDPLRTVLDLRRCMLLVDGRCQVSACVALRVRALRLASLADRAVGLQALEFEAEGGELGIELEAQWGSAPALVQECETAGLRVWRTQDSRFRLGAATLAVLCAGDQEVEPQLAGPFHARWRWQVRPEAPARLIHVIAMARREADSDDAGVSAQASLESVRARGWEPAIADHEAAWTDRWRASDVEIGGDAAAQQDLRFALYHLISAANPADERVSVAARGLTGTDYNGHVFWDTENYLLPFYTLTDPAAARALLLYRFHTLDAARTKAARLSWRGALYAWESAATGEETTPEHAIGLDGRSVEILAGKQEQHISADVAYAVWNYWRATGDEAFWLGAGAEILLETARFWASRAQLEADGRRHIRGVIGPDEYHTNIDDNAYTNVMARWNLERGLEAVRDLQRLWPARWAVLAKRLGLSDDELCQWRVAAETIVTGFDPKTGLYEQFAGYFELEDIDLANYPGRTKPMDVVLGPARIQASQVSKQADVVELMAVLAEVFPPGAAEANFRYYAARCGHGSSLSRVTHGLVAAQLGQVEAALAYFRDAAGIDLLDSQGPIGGGVHIAGLGGLWMTAVYGFGGLSFTGEGLFLDPHLPPEWSSLAFRVQWRGRCVKFSIRQSGAIEAALEVGQDAPLNVRGRGYTIRSGQPLRIDSPGAERAPHGVMSP